MKFTRLAISIVLLFITSNECFAQESQRGNLPPGTYPFNDPAVPLERRVASLLNELTLKEKAGFLSGETLWQLQAIDRLGIPSLQMTDCGHGVTVILDNNHKHSGCATSFPTAVAQAATWDPELIFKTGAAIAQEARATGSSVLLGPMVNIHRVPVGGRNYESYSEDPFLTGKLAGSFIKGVQSQHVGAVIKGFVANNQQKDQEHLSVKISARALHEIYFPAFRMAIEEADPVGVMTSYNGINGVPASESNYLITDVLKKEWGFKGFVVSDWRAVVSSNAITAGLDLEMPGPGKFMGRNEVLEALKNRKLTEEELDERVSRYLRAILRSGQLDITNSGSKAEFSLAENRKVAREVAESSIVLLKNEQKLLPLDIGSLKKIAVFGPNALTARLGGGGSASVTACRTVSPLQGLENYLAGRAIKINFLEGASFSGNYPVIPPNYLNSEVNGKQVEGLNAEVYDGLEFKGPVKCSKTDKEIDFSWGWMAPCENVGKWNYSVRWSGKISSPHTGIFKIGLSFKEAGARMFIDGKLVIDEWGDPVNEVTEAKFVSKSKFVEIYMEKSSSHDIKIEFHKKGQKNAIRLEWEVPGLRDPIQDAVELARQSDIAIIYAGLSNLFEGGNNDRSTIDLPGNQDQLIRAVSAANPNTIVVLMNGTPLEMPWIKEVKSVLEAFYPGQEGGDALANIIFGAVNPSGKMPDTYPVRLEDVEAMKYYPGKDGQVEYKEDIFVGYRQFERDKIKPMFPFGFGLSYTTFKFEGLNLIKRNNEISVTLNITNVGPRSGSEVVQIYVANSEFSMDRPVKELKGFKKVYLEPGETQSITIPLNDKAFMCFDESQNTWVKAGDKFFIMAGNSSDNILLKKSVRLK